MHINRDMGRHNLANGFKWVMSTRLGGTYTMEYWVKGLQSLRKNCYDHCKEDNQYIFYSNVSLEEFLKIQCCPATNLKRGVGLR